MTIELTWKKNGRAGNATVTVLDDDQLVAVDTFNLLKVDKRAAFLRTIMDQRPELDAMDVEQQLLGIASQVQLDEAPSFQSEEVEPGRVVRPELFHMPEVSGIAIPATVKVYGEGRAHIRGRFYQYLRFHGDGHRERIAFSESLTLEGAEPIWFHPTPSEPSPQTPCGWSSRSREEWLDGAAAPDPADVFHRILAIIDKFVDWPRDEALGHCSTLACWVFLSYTFPAWPAVPYLFFAGPAGSGKTRCFDVLERLVFRPISTSNISSAALFRTLHDRGGSVLFDEAEQLKRSNDPGVGELLSMLLAGYRRGGRALRLEKVGDRFGTVSFDVFGPKALACINGLPTALSSRAIEVPMFRAPADSPKPRRRLGDCNKEWQSLRDDLHVMALEHGPTWRQLARRPEVCPSDLGGRDYEKWQPLLAIGSWLDSAGVAGLYQQLVDHAGRMIESGRDDQVSDSDAVLLRLVYRAVQNFDHPTPKELLAAAQEAEPTTFKSWTAKAVSNHLKRYGVNTMKSHGRRLYRNEIGDLERVAKTYGIDLEVD